MPTFIQSPPWEALCTCVGVSAPAGAGPAPGVVLGSGKKDGFAVGKVGLRAEAVPAPEVHAPEDLSVESRSL